MVLLFCRDMSEKLGIISVTESKNVSVVGNSECDTSVPRDIVNRDALKGMYPECFEGIGKIPKKYQIVLRNDAVPVISPPRKYPVQLKSGICNKLKEMEKIGVIEKVPDDTVSEWVSSLAFSRKVSRELRICLDPKKLNQAIKRTYIQHLLRNYENDPFVQDIILVKNQYKIPSFVLGLDQSFMDINQFCHSDSHHPSVLGIDRTFNLGPCYATVLVYQHNNVYRRGTTNNPCMLGPIFLHWKADYQHYVRFFQSVKLKLNLVDEEINLGHQIYDYTIGSDEEKAITKALKFVFPNSVLVLCSRHMEENTSRKMKSLNISNRIR